MRASGLHRQHLDRSYALCVCTHTRMLFSGKQQQTPCIKALALCMILHMCFAPSCHGAPHLLITVIWPLLQPMSLLLSGLKAPCGPQELEAPALTASNTRHAADSVTFAPVLCKSMQCWQLRISALRFVRTTQRHASIRNRPPKLDKSRPYKDSNPPAGAFSFSCMAALPPCPACSLAATLPAIGERSTAA